MHDIAHYLRPAHLASCAASSTTPRRSNNDRFVALDLLKNANIAAGGVLPMCQDTGTAIVMGKRGQHVLTAGHATRRRSAAGVFDAYTRLNLRYSQMAPLTMWDERNTGSNLPAQIELYADTAAGHETTYKFLFMAKGGGCANKSFLYQETKAVLNPERMLRFLDEKLRALGTAACPPYHLAIVIGGTSAEFALKTAKYASAQVPRRAADVGVRSPAHGFRDIELEAAGARADPRLRHRRAVRRQVLLPRRPRRAAAPARRLAARSPSRCPARPTGRRSARSPPRASSSSSSRPTRPASCPTTTDEHLGDERGRRSGDVVRIDLNRPMDEIRAELSKHPVKTRLSLTGPLVVARDIAHAKIKERLDAGEPMPQYLRDHAVYYAGPAKTPEGYAVRLVRPDDRRPDGLLRRAVPGGRRLDGHAGQGQPQSSRSPTAARRTAASTSARSAARRPGWPRTASSTSRCSSTPSSAWRRSGRSRSRTSRPSSSSTTRATTSSPRSPSRSPSRSRSAPAGVCSSGCPGPSDEAGGAGSVPPRPRRRGRW